MNIIETTNLSHRYWRTEAVRNLNLAVPAGSVMALLGSNGAGKTTTLKMLVNLLRPTAGSAQVLGVDSRQLGEKEMTQLGYVSESQQLPLWMTVRQFLDFQRPFYPQWDAALERTLLQRLALPPERKLKQLSRGMLMKAALLSSLAYRPKLLILDEPFSGLDPVARDDFTHGLLEAVQQGETSVLISSHDIEEVERLADRIALLQDGSLGFAESTDSLLGRFRRIEIDREVSVLGADAPATWVGWENGANRASFVDTAYDRAATEQACRLRFPAATVRAQPMTLREIFIVLARASQKNTGAAA
jgi:ABC-2 type transport system ATP-binding protein